MSRKNTSALATALMAGVLAVGNFGCGSGASAPISVSLSNTTATVEVGATAQFKATVTNDGANAGVNWIVSCPAQPCGSVSPTSTASGASTTYTPPNSQTSTLTVSLTATSVSDATKSQTAIITVPAVTISLSSTSANLQLGAQAPFSATVTNDGANAGVNWTVSCPQAACGSVSLAQTGSGAATTYTAPSAPPAGNLAVTLTATSATDSAVVASATITVPGILIAVSPNNPSVESGGTQQFTATVTGDPSNGGVTWQVVMPHYSCNPITRRCYRNGYAVCGHCGAVSPSSTASGAPITYTAPGTAPLSAYLQAISVTNGAAWSVVPINLLPISVTVSSTAASVALKATVKVSATVANDATNKGVTWTLAQNGVACAPGCGTIAPTSTASSGAATYTAPATASTLPLVTITATSVEDNTKTGYTAATLTTSTGAAACGGGSGSESLLKGQYAFLLHGLDQNAFPILAGSFTADGTGKVTGGEKDGFITSGPETDVAINAAGSAYAVGPDHRGCLVLANADGRLESYRFGLGSINASSVATAGHLIEFGDAAASGNSSAGTIRLQDSASFSSGQFKGNYAFGVYGSSYAAMIGVLTSDGVSALTSVDLDAVGPWPATNSSFTPGGTFTCCSANGRGTVVLQYNGLSSPFYMINSGDAFLLTTIGGLGSGGEAIAIPSGTTFTQASLNGAAVLRETVANPLVRLATVNADGNQTVTVNESYNNQGTFSTDKTVFTYQVASNGRVAFSGGNPNNPVIYLYGPNQGFVADGSSNFGVLEPQTGGPFSDSAFSGTYMLGTQNPTQAPVANGVTLESGVVAADGNGNAAGIVDQFSPAGLADNQSLNFTYSIAADGTGNVGTGTTAIVISPNKLAYFNNTDPNPTITVVEK